MDLSPRLVSSDSHHILLSTRHIQNLSEAAGLVDYWGYGQRAVPCTNDAGSCAYLDLCYRAHQLSMLYTGIIWASFAGILFIWCLFRFCQPSRRSDLLESSTDLESGAKERPLYRLTRTVCSAVRQHFLPESFFPLFGRTTRSQVTILALITGYLTVFTFVGLTYQKWITPVKKHPGVFNTRTTLGPWADRIGVLAYALTPLSILLSSRESILSLATGLPYQHFNFLHRWLGYVILVQSWLHSIGWIIVEANLYRPQPSVWNEFVVEPYVIWGLVAIILLSLMFVLSLPSVIRFTGYEAFRKLHYVLAMVYIGACWAHWEKLSCWLIPSLIVWLIDRAIRLCRTATLHHRLIPGTSNKSSFRSAEASSTIFTDEDNGDVVRLDFEHNHDAWRIGQHFYLCFPQLSIWQSHPFTPASIPGTKRSGQQHTYIIRAKSGETARLAQIIQEGAHKEQSRVASSISVVLQGPYGSPIVDRAQSRYVNVLCVAGGTGITFVLPVLHQIVSKPPQAEETRLLQLVWAIRKKSDMRWIQPELTELVKAGQKRGLIVHIFVTREEQTGDPPEIDQDPKRKAEEGAIHATSSSSSSSSSSSLSISSQHSEEDSKVVRKLVNVHKASVRLDPRERHPTLGTIVPHFVEGTISGPTIVYASGPGGMISDLRKAVASCNDPGKVWRGDDRFDVELISDNRLEW